MFQELTVIRNSVVSPHYRRLVPISEVEKHRDHTRARWNVSTSHSDSACANIEAYAIDERQTKVKFTDGNIRHQFTHDTTPIGQGFDEFVKMIITEIGDNVQECNEQTGKSKHRQQQNVKEERTESSQAEELLELKPNFYGVGVNLKVLIRRFRRWLSQRTPQ